jgi:hypothetical protein
MYNVHLPENYPCEILNYSSISDLYSLKNCIDKIEGIDSYSGSITQKLKIHKNKENIYMKMFISETPEIIDSLKDTKIKNKETGEYVNFDYNKDSLQNNNSNLLYEQFIYKNYINKLVDNNICPFFIRMIGCQNNVNMYSILNFLNDKLIDTKGNIVPYKTIEKTLLRNTSIMLYIFGKMAMSLNEEIISMSMSNISNDIFPKDLKQISLKELTNIRYGYTITESPKNALNMKEFIKKTLNVSRKGKSFENKFIPMIYYIIFQIILSCKILDMCKINHNDLHFGNILIHKYNKTRNLICNFKKNNKKVYKLNYPLSIKIFDFDISHLYGNKKNTNFNMNPEIRDIKNISQIKNIINKFMYYLTDVPKDYDFNENEKDIYTEFINDKISNIFIKNTNFDLNFIDKNKKPIKINYNNKSDSMNKILDLIKIHHTIEEFTDNSFDDNFYDLDTIIDKIYNDDMFKKINKRNNNHEENYYITYKMVDVNGTFINTERDYFIKN